MLINDFGSYELWQISLPSLMDFSEFVANVNYNKYLNVAAPKEEITSIYNTEVRMYNCSQLFAIKSTGGHYLGTIRIAKWDRISALPIETDFGVDIDKLLQQRQLSPTVIWHVGRLTVSTNTHVHFSLRQQSAILRILLAQVCHVVCSCENSVLFAECDERLFRTFPSLNIDKAQQLGDSAICMASPTVPIMIEAAHLQHFRDKHKMLNYV